MPMEIMKYTMDLPKDFKEVVDLIDAIIEKVKAKADMAEYLELIGKLTAAADGVQNVSEAVKGQYRDECTAYLVKTLMERLAPGVDPESEVASE